MNFFLRRELDHAADAQLRAYDVAVRKLVGVDFPWPIRMRDWELVRVLRSLVTVPPCARVLEIGAFNTYLSAYLATKHAAVVASDRLAHRRRKSLLRRFRLAERKSTEAPYSVWHHVLRTAGVSIRDYDATGLPCPDGFFDCVIAVSVLEHIPDVERAIAELYRVLTPGGKLLLTLDCAPEPVPYRAGVRYFSPSELDRIFAHYPVTSPRTRPDFSPVNWCYGGSRAVVAAFVEVTKPQRPGDLP